jgi:hypothetical protein
MDIGELFPAGPILDEEHQIGRLNPIEGMTDRLRAGDVIRVFDRRRWGKSSVARAALTRLETEGLITVRLALDEYPTPAAAAAVLAEVFSTRSERAATVARALGSRLGGALLRGGQATSSEEASAVGGLLQGLRPEEVTLRRVLEAIPSELSTRDRRGAIVIDEAHIIAGWESEARASLRAFMADGDRRAGIALASSDSRAERKLRRSSVLGYLGEEFSLPPIEIADWTHALRLRFEAAGVPIDGDALALLLEESRGHPYCTMLLAKQTAQLAQTFGASTTSVVQLALPTVRKHDAWKKLR